MCAAHLVRLDFQARQRICMRAITQHQVIVFLIGVCMLTVWIDIDVAAPCRLRSVPEHCSIQQIAGSMRCDVFLGSADINMLARMGERQTEHLNGASRAFQRGGLIQLAQTTSQRAGDPA